jgi:hypothetical protein
MTRLHAVAWVTSGAIVFAASPAERFQALLAIGAVAGFVAFAHRVPPDEPRRGFPAAERRRHHH